ncbi:MAG: BlaI/MecI/CopY family transcriptional regulator [Phycisphaerales bacterium JB063]
MKTPPALSDAEWEVMNVVWDTHPATAAQVVDALPRRSSQTVKTLLNRLLHKGALRYEAEGKRYLYCPAMTRERCLRQASKSFINHVFSGDPGSLVSHLIEHHRLSEQDLAALRDQLDEAKKTSMKRRR